MLNEVKLIGRLGKDPEISYTPAGVAITKFSLATSERYKDKNGEKVEKTEWHNIVTWGQAAEIYAKYLKKGSLIYVSGRISTKSYEDKEGVKRYFTFITAQNVLFLNKVGSDQDREKVPDDGLGPDGDYTPVDDVPF